MEILVRENLFNTPLECGLRLLVLLSKSHPTGCDVDRLLVYDYLLVHSGDVQDGPNSLHPPSPLRAGELLVRRSLLEKGLRLLMCKSLAERRYVGSGIEYCATDLAQPFLSYFESPYFERASATAEWLIASFNVMETNALRNFASDMAGRWGTELIMDDLIDEGAY